MVEGRKRSLATRRKISLAQKGRKNSMYGRRHTMGTRKRISFLNKGKGNPMYGKKHKSQTIAKMRLAARRRMVRKAK